MAVDPVSGLPYVDAAEGMGRIGGNKALFLRLLDTFIKDVNWEKLNNFLKEGNLPDAAAAAHAIKGMAANLSMKALSAKAAELEALLKSGASDDGILAQLAEVYQETLNEVAQIKAAG